MYSQQTLLLPLLALCVQFDIKTSVRFESRKKSYTIGFQSKAHKVTLIIQ